MIFTTPFIPFQSELISLLTKADEMTFEVYDSGLSIDEILGPLQSLSNVHYGVIADISCTPDSAKADSIMWRVNVRVELFSSYKGRKQVAEMINLIGSTVTKYAEAFDQNLSVKGYSVIRQEIGESVIGAAVFMNGLTWQNGYINLNYYLYQLDS